MTEAPHVNLEALRLLNESGYGYYLVTAQVREDDLMVRNRAADCLHRAAAAVARLEQAARHAVPPPSRAQPFPDPALLAKVRELKTLGERIAAVETRLRGAAALPDRDFSALIPSDAVRAKLVALDAQLVGHAAAVESGAESAVAVPPLLEALEASIAERCALAAIGKAA